MNTRQIIVIFCLFVVFFSALSIASASETGDNSTVSVANDQNTINAPNNNEILADPDGTFTGLESQIQLVPNNGSLSLETNYAYDGNGHVINISKNMIIDGQGHIIDASGQIAIFNVENNSHVILNGITFTNGHGENGGAINVYPGSSVEIINCTFSNNNATNFGGAIYIVADDSGLISKITDSIFEDNTAYNGGAIYVQSDKATVENSIFTGNGATNDGAGVYVAGDYCNLANSTFADNVGGDDGAAIYWQGSNGMIYNISCSNNRGISGFDPREGKNSNSKGGTICLTGSNVTVSKSSFKDSFAKSNAGAIFITGNYINVIDNVFDNCTACDDKGGALHVIGNHTNILGCDFENCNANLSGGVIYVEGHDATIDHATFTQNGANLDGGALYVAGDNCILSNSTFTANTAGDDGGAVFWEGDNGSIYNITCINNKGISDIDPVDKSRSNSKGGTICLTGSNVTIDKSTFTQSSAKVDGGAIFITGNYVKVLNSEFSDSVSTSSSGGALYIIGNYTDVLKCTFNNCEVNQSAEGNPSGGAIFVEGNHANILDSTFTDTRALIGGAINIEGNYVTVDNSVFSHNNASGPAGGSGGAIHIKGEHTVISNSEFSDTAAVNYGGALAVWGPHSVIANNTFSDSSTELYYGGSIYVNGRNTTISNSNFTRTKTKNDFARGGAVEVSGDESRILDCNFDDCYAFYGGAIHVSGVKAEIDGVDIKNSDAYDGGAIYVDGTYTTISNSNFTGIEADRYGGAIYVNGAFANISQNNFNDCTVEYYHGGAIYVAGADATIEKSNFTSCHGLSGVARGGAIDVEGDRTTIKESNFDECEAVQGGAIYVEGNFAKLENSNFTSTTAVLGGAMYLSAWGAVINGANITNSKASENGGAIYVAGGGTNIAQSNFEDCTAQGNTANNGGGAIYIYGSDTHIQTSTFDDNQVAGDKARGGTIYIEGKGTLIETSVFNDGYASQGGVIYIKGEKTIIDSSLFANSSSLNYGGAISVSGHNTTIQNSEFENIQSGADGGAIYIDGADTNILQSSFDACTVGSKNKGGAIYINDDRTTVAYSNFTHSKAGTGGAVYIAGENTTFSYCDLNDNTATDAGAVYISGVNTIFSNCNLDHNTAVKAGAVKVTGDNTLFTDCNLTDNTATNGDGGALDIAGNNASVKYSWFDNNLAVKCGGAILWQGGHGDDSIIGTTFTNNRCRGNDRGGGAIYWDSGNDFATGGMILDSIFINNTAEGRHGGAIDWYRAKDSKFDNCLFINNHANKDGGALYTGHQTGMSNNLTISNSQFYNNSAGSYGGAIANQMGGTHVINNTFDGNWASASGGTILMKEGYADNSVIDHCYIYNSHCVLNKGYQEGGGAILIGKDDSNITISNCYIINSTTEQTYGGAVAVLSEKSTMINVTIENAKTIDGDGGAIYWKGNQGTLKDINIFNSSTNSNSNLRSANGGAIHVSGSYCNLDNISIASSSSNIVIVSSTVPGDGGAIYVADDAKGNTITNVVIDESSASSVKMDAKGGAIYWGGASGTLKNATISNTLANGQGGAIYWKGGSPDVDNISITYSQTNVTGSSNSADGGAIYSIGIYDLKNVVVTDAIASTENGDIKGGAIYYEGNTLRNVTVTGSRAMTDDGNASGGALYWKGGSDGYIYNSTFEKNRADLGGAIYSDRTIRGYNVSFLGNVAERGGAIYGSTGDVIFYNGTFILNSAKKGGAIYTDDVQVLLYDSYLSNNSAEEEGGAIYHDYVGKTQSSIIQNTELVNNTAFQGSAIFATQFVRFTLKDVVLLDNQANAIRFTNKTVGVLPGGTNYTSAVFVGNDNILNAIWVDSDQLELICDNVTYLGTDGIMVINSTPRKSYNEVRQNITVYVYNEKGENVTNGTVVTDGDGKFIFPFDAQDGEIYNFAYEHKTDRYYTYLRDTYSYSSIVKIWINNCTYGENASALISLTDGAWGNLSGNVTVKLNDTKNTTFTVEIINSTLVRYNITGLPVGVYNATATFEGNITCLGDTDWCLFEVYPVFDVAIFKDVNITADYVNVTDIIKYNVTVTNYGPSGARKVNVIERLSPYLRLISSDTNGYGSYNLTAGNWYIGDLEANETAILTIIAEVIHAGPILNDVWVNYYGNDTNLSNDKASAHNFTAVPILDLRIIKKVNFTGDIINVLDTIKFNITVFNDGPCNATGVVVGEVLSPRLRLISYDVTAGNYSNGTWNIGNLLNGTNATLTIVAQVIYSGIISNAVNVTGFENETNYTNNFDAIKNITAIANVDLKINKTVNVTDNKVNVTDIIKFVITVTNDGPCNASGVYVGEYFDYEHLEILSNSTTIGEFDGATWVIGKLDKGAIHNLTIIAKVIAAGNFTNFVNVTSEDNDTNMSNNNYTLENITAFNIVDLLVNKTVNVNLVNVTDIIIYTITVKNNGPCIATGVNVTDVLDSHLKLYDNVTWVGHYNVTTGVWDIGDLGINETVQLVLYAQVISNGTIPNVVVVSSNENDTNTSNNNYPCENVTALPIVDVGINKTVNGTTIILNGVNVTRVNVSDILKFTIIVTNKGPSNATMVNVTEVLDSHLRLVDNYTDHGYYNLTGGYWYIGDLANGTNATLTLLAKVVNDGYFENRVTVTRFENDTNPFNEEDYVTISAQAVVDVKVNKTVNVTVANVTDKILYTIIVHNNGPSDAHWVNVYDILDSHLTLIEYNASVGDYIDSIWYVGDLPNGTSENLTIVAEINSAGVIPNFVRVTSDEPDTNMSNNNYTCENVTASNIVDLMINKTVDVKALYVNVSDIIQFTIYVKNKGPCDATNVTVVEVLDSHLKLIDYSTWASDYNVTTGIWYIGDLAKDDWRELFIMAQVISVGNISNVVVVNSTEKDTNESNNRDNITNITALPVVDVAITKKTNVTIANITDKIKFTIFVENNGPCNATQVNVTEVLDSHVRLIDNHTDVGYYNLTGGYWYIGDLEVGKNATLTLTVEVVVEGYFENRVHVTSYENDTQPWNNEAVIGVSAYDLVDLMVNKTVNVNVANVTDKITYTIIVHNNGPSDAHWVNVFDILDSHLSLVDYNASVGKYENSIWVIGNVPNGTSVNLTIVAEVTSVGVIPNFVRVESAEPDSNMTNNNYTCENVTALPIVDIEVNKTVNVIKANVTEIIYYTITVKNNGPCVATGVNVTDVLDSHLKLYDNVTWVGHYNVTTGVWDIGDLAVNETVQLIIYAEILTNGTIPNVVTVVSTENDTNMSNNNYTCENVTALPIVDVWISKTANVTNVNVSNRIKFTVTVTNDGPSNATHVNVTEVLDSHLKLVSNSTDKGYYNLTGGYWYIGDLAKGKNATLTIIAEVIRAGYFENRVVVTRFENDTQPWNDHAEVGIFAHDVVDMTVNKTVNVKVANVTDKIVYTIIVHNNGPSNATWIRVYDILDAHLTLVDYNASVGTYENSIWAIGDLASGASANMTIIAEVNAVGVIPNFVRVESAEPDSNMTNNNYTCENVTALPIVDIVVNKTVNVNKANVSEIIYYTITVKNNGPCAATGVNVTDILDSHLKLYDNVTWVGHYNVTTGVWDIGDLAVNETVQLIIYAEILTNGTIPNVVTVVSTENDTNMSNNNYTCENVTALPIVDVWISKTVNISKVNVSDRIKFTVTVTNDGPSNATQVNVTEVLDSHLKLVSNSTDKGYYNLTGGYWYIGDLAKGKNATLTIIAEVIRAGYFENRVVVTRFENDTQPWNDHAEVGIFAYDVVDLMVNKTVDVKVVNVTGRITYTIIVRNNGPSNATWVSVYDILDSHLTLVDYNASVGKYENSIWTIGDLGNGTSANITIVAEVNSPGVIPNFVRVEGAEPDSNMTNNNYTCENVTAYPIVDLWVTKTVNPNTVNVNDIICYTITVHNNGPSDATDVNVTDILDSHLKYSSASTLNGRYDPKEGVWHIGDLANDTTAYLYIFAQVISNGTIPNVVNVTSNENDTNKSNNNYTCENVTAYPIVDVWISKTANITKVNVSDRIKFTITVTNDGPSNATQVNVTEVLDSHLKLINNYTTRGYYNVTGGYWYIGDLAKGKNATLTIIAEVIRADYFENRVVVTRFENDTQPWNDHAEVGIFAYDVVDLMVNKTVDVKFANVTDRVTYTIIVHNYGPSNATWVNVYDILDSHLTLVDYNASVGKYENSIWTIGDLACGATENLTIVAEVNSIGIIPNFVRVEGAEPDRNMSNNNYTCENVTAIPVVDIVVNKTVNVNKANVSEIIYYTITVKNNGPWVATGVNVTDVLDSHLELYDNVTWKGHYNVTTGVWDIGDLAVNETVQLIIYAKIISNGTIPNVVVVVSNENDTNMSNNNYTSENVTALPIVDVWISKTANISKVNVSDRIKFTITVTNDGPCNATQVNVTEVLDSHLRLVSNSTDCGYYNVTGGYWYIGDLAKGENATLTIIAEVVRADYFENRVVVTRFENDTQQWNNHAEVGIFAYDVVDLMVNKTVNVKVANVTDKIVYTIIVHNNGPSNATWVNVYDILDAHLTLVDYNASVGKYENSIWTIGDLASGATENLTIIAEVNSPGIIPNFVRVEGAEPDRNMSNNNYTCENVTASNIVDIVVNKTVNVTKVNVTDYIKYTITVVNNGPSNATGVNVTDKLDSRLEFDSFGSSREGITYDSKTGIVVIGNLDANETVILTIVAKVMEVGIIPNTVNVTSNENDTNKSNDNYTSDNVTALPIVDIVVNKTVNVTVVNVTDYIRYTITVVNNGPSNATGVNVTDKLDSALEFDSFGSSREGITYDSKTGIVVIGNLDANETVILTIVAMVKEVGIIPNAVNVTSTENDTNKSNDNYTSDNVTALPIVDIKINKTVNVTEVNVGDLVKFTIKVTNAGPSNATGVNVTDKLDSALSLVSFGSSREGITYDSKTGTAVIGNLDANETVVLTVVARVLSVGTIPNTANVTSNENDTNKSNNNDSSKNITSVVEVNLSVSKTVNVTLVNVTDYIKYTITVVNDGPNNATGVNVTEVLSPLVKFVKAETKFGRYDNVTNIWHIGDLTNHTTAVLYLTVQVISNGTIANMVIGNSTENKTPVDANSTNVTALPIVDLKINKTVNVTVVNVTDYIKYTITVVNDGPSNATGVNVTDKLDSRLEFDSFGSSREGITYDSKTGIAVIGNLDANETVILTIVAKVMEVGIIPNAVNVTGTQNDTNKSNDNYTSDNVTALPIVDIKINKTVNVTEVNVGDLVKFTIKVTNAGPSNATGVNVTDKLDSALSLVSFDSSRTGITYDSKTGIVVIGNLDANETVVLTVVARVLSVGTIPNTANVTSNENDTNKSNNNDSSKNITSVVEVNLSVYKTVNVTLVNVTDYIKYTITVVNDGPNNATGVNITESLSPLVKFVKAETKFGRYDNVTNVWHIGDLTNHTTAVLYLTVQVISNGTIANMVIGNSTENKTPVDANSTNVTALPIVDLKVNKTVNVTLVNVTDYIKYTITVVNNGPSNATGVNVTDKLDGLLKFISFDSSRSGITYDNKTGIAVIGNLDANETVVLTIVARVMEVGIIPNAVIVTGKENDTNMSNNNYTSDNVTALPIVDVKINKTVNVEVVKIGDKFTYVITVVNDGPSTATDVNVHEKLSDYVSLVDFTPSKGDYDVGKCNWHIDELRKGETATLTILVEVISNGTIENVVSVTSHENDTNKSNNEYPCENVTSGKLNTPIGLDTYDITYGDDEILTVTLPDKATGTVNITVGDRTYKDVPIDHGKVVLPVIDLAGGDYTVDVYYGGDETYQPNSTSGTFNVARVVPVITIEVEDIWVGEVEVLNVTVNAPGTVNITVNGITVTIPLDNGVMTTDVLAATIHDYHGKATWNIVNLPVGAYPAFAIYPGNENYTSVSTSDLFHVMDIPTTVIVTADDIHVGEDAVILIKVGPEGVSGNVTVTLEGKKYTVAIDEDGKAALVVPGLKAGLKEVTVEYNGTIVYRPSENSTTFNVLKVKPPVDVVAPEITVGEDGVITVTVPDDATGTITIEIEGKTYTAEIKDGKAVFIIPGLKVGIHDIKAYYSGDDKYLPANATGSIKVNPKEEPVIPTTKKSAIVSKMHATGNPIMALMIVLLFLSFVQIRRFKK